MAEQHAVTFLDAQHGECTCGEIFVGDNAFNRGVAHADDPEADRARNTLFTLIGALILTTDEIAQGA